MDKKAEREGVMTEADTCREFVTPRLVEAGWSVAPHVIGEQRTFTNGRIKFAYATNGHRIIEIDYTTGTEREVDRSATPAELWRRLTAAEQVLEVRA